MSGRGYDITCFCSTSAVILNSLNYCHGYKCEFRLDNFYKQKNTKQIVLIENAPGELTRVFMSPVSTIFHIALKCAMPR